MKKVISFLAAFLMMLSAAPCSAAEAGKGTAQKAVQETIDQLVAAVEKYGKEEQLTERRDKLREIIEPRFDFEEMAKRSLGRQWKDRTEAEQVEFVSVFSELLAKTYLDKIENIRSNMVSITGEKLAPPKALVKTKVEYKGDTFPLDYKLLHEGNEWKVYDVVIENIGLVSNYRNEFAGIIRKNDFAGLVSQLKAKVQKH
ncbi:MAG: ABC transporter substrate-binding protein [Bdellovibrionales bacterium]|nr:ABC transporter substrate-binding protein [Bdellovibrionales bacterium]